MQKTLIFTILLIAVSGCTPPDKLAEERAKHAEEMRALVASRQQIINQLHDVQLELDTCKHDLQDERALRNDAQRAVAYMQWCDFIGSRLGMCNDPLYHKGAAAMEAGEIASDEWQYKYYGRTAAAIGVFLFLVLGVPWLALEIAHFLGFRKTRDEIRKAEYKLFDLKEQHTRFTAAILRARVEQKELEEEKEGAEAELQKKRSDLKKAKGDLDRIKRAIDMLKV